MARGGLPTGSSHHPASPIPGPPTQRQSLWHFLYPPGRQPGPAPSLRKRISCLSGLDWMS